MILMVRLLSSMCLSLQIYRACGHTLLCYPLLFEVTDFYLSQDMEFVIDDVKVRIR